MGTLTWTDISSCRSGEKEEEEEERKRNPVPALQVQRAANNLPSHDVTRRHLLFFGGRGGSSPKPASSSRLFRPLLSPKLKSVPKTAQPEDSAAQSCA